MTEHRPPESSFGTEQRSRLCFIHGISLRSGTHFLESLLRLHPDCRRAGGNLPENFFVAYSDHLLRYAQLVRGQWQAEWTPDWEPESVLHQAFGDAILGILFDHGPGVQLATTPSARNVQHVETLFPGCKQIVIVRDGRSVMASVGAGFDCELRHALRSWLSSSQAIVPFEATNPAEASYCRVRYEDLLDADSPEIDRVLEFLGVDASLLDRDRVRAMPVIGSSFDPSTNGLDWQPRAIENFQPKVRWADWTRREHEFYRLMAGSYHAYFGYEHQAFPRSVVPWKLLYRLYRLPRAKDLVAKIRHRLGMG